MEESAEKSEYRRESCTHFVQRIYITVHRTSAEERTCAPFSTEEERHEGGDVAQWLVHNCFAHSTETRSKTQDSNWSVVSVFPFIVGLIYIGLLVVKFISKLVQSFC